MRPQSYRKNCKKLRKADRGRKSLHHGRSHLLIIQYKIVSLENTHVSKIRLLIS